MCVQLSRYRQDHIQKKPFSRPIFKIFENMASSSSSTIWEEAEGEFYQEAFLNRSRDSTLDSGRRTDDEDNNTLTSRSMDTVIHRPLIATGAGAGNTDSLTSRLLSGSSGVGSKTKMLSKGRSARMRASIQGLGADDSDGEGAAGPEADDYGNGGNGFFLSGEL